MLTEPEIHQRRDLNASNDQSHNPGLASWIAGVALGLALLVCALALLVDLFDRRLIGSRLISIVEEQTGRTLSMEDFDLRWGWPLALRAEELRFANASWGRDDAMLQIPVATFYFTPSGLLSGPPYGEIELQQPRVLVEQSSEGEWNWALETESSGSDAPPSMPVSVRAEDGEVLYVDGDQQVLQLKLEELTADIPERLEQAGGTEFAARGDLSGLPLSLAGALEFAPPNWDGRAEFQLGESALSAEFLVDVSSEPMVLRGSLESERLAPMELSNLAAVDPAQALAAEDDAPATLTLPELDGINIDVEISIAELQLNDISLNSIEARLATEAGTATVEPLSAELGGLAMEASIRLESLIADPVLSVDYALARQPLSALPAAMPLSQQPGEVAADASLRISMPERQVPLNTEAILAQLAVPQSRVIYAREWSELPISRVEAADDEASLAEAIATLVIEPAGGRPNVSLTLDGAELPEFDASVQAPPLRELITPAPYLVELSLSTASMQASAEAQLCELLDGEGFSLRVSASGQDLPALPAFGFNPPAIEPFDIQGNLSYAQGRWQMQDMRFDYGDSELTGSLLYHPGEVPRLNLDLEADLLDLTALPGMSEAETEEQAEQAAEDTGEALLSDTLASNLRSMNGDVTLSANRLILPGDYQLSSLALSAALEGGNLAVETLSFEAAGGSIDASLNARAAELPINGDLNLRIENIAVSEIDESFAQLQEHLGLVSGELQIEAALREPQPADEDLLLPTIGRLSLRESDLRFSDPDAGTDLRISLDTTGLGDPDQTQTVNISGAGSYRGEPASLSLRGDPLLDLRDDSAPYALSLELELAETQVALEGEIAQPWSPEAANFTIDASGPDLARLDVLPFDLPFSSSGPFEIEGRVSLNEDRFEIQELDGTIGDSDLQGSVAFDLTEEGPANISADLNSANMDYADISSLLGSDAAEESSTQGESDADSGSETLLPRETFDLSALERLNFDIAYSAETFEYGGMTFDDIDFDIDFEEGQIDIAPLSIAAGGGRIDTTLELEINGNEVSGIIEAEASSINLAQLVEDFDLGANSFGIIGGQGKFWVRGDSIASLLGSADGGLMFLMTGGGLDSLLVEAAGLDIGEATLVASGLSEPVPIDCAYASVLSDSGVLSVDRFVIDTRDTLFFLDGQANLVEETLDLTLYPEAKDLGLLAVDTPLQFGGSFLDPEINLFSDALAVDFVSAAALATLVGPISALLPFVELSPQSEPEVCSGWVEALREERKDDS